jgi:hypothetical protein
MTWRASFRIEASRERTVSRTNGSRPSGDRRLLIAFIARALTSRSGSPMAHTTAARARLEPCLALSTSAVTIRTRTLSGSEAKRPRSASSNAGEGGMPKLVSALTASARTPGSGSSRRPISVSYSDG